MAAPGTKINQPAIFIQVYDKEMGLNGGEVTYKFDTSNFNIACEWLGKVERMLNKQHETN